MNTDILTILQNLENKDAIALFFDWLQKMIQELDIKVDDKKLRLTPRPDDLKISVNINHRTVLRIFRKEKVIYLRLLIRESDLEAVRSKFTLIAKDKSQEKFQTILVDIDHAQILNSPDATFLLEKWFNACKIHYDVSLNSTQTEKNNPELYEMAVSKELREKYLSAANTNQILLERYKNIIRETHLKQELYKWEKVQQFQGRPNTEVVDFQQELKNIQFENLIYQIAKSVMLSLAKEKTEEYRACMQNLFDEAQLLSDRVVNFVKESDKLYNLISPQNTSHHDERTIATLLTYKYPEKYAFYKDSFYQKYCKLLNIPTEKKNKKYVHYLTLIQDLKENFLQKDAELLEMVKGFLPPNSYADTSLNILSQDILYQVLDRELDNNLLQMDFETVINQLKEYLKTNFKDTRISNFALKDKGKNWVWILDNPTAPQNATSYEIERENEMYQVYLIIDRLEGKEDIFYQWVRNSLPKELELFHWKRVTTDSIRFKETISQTDMDLIPKLAKQLLYLEENVGKKIMEILNSNDTNSNSQTNEPKRNNMPKHPLNQILYGPPGTGKTYNTINEALAIIEGKEAQTFENEDRTELTTRYKKYVEAGQIMFTTFHQSMSYEDFIEGIKPETSDKGQVTYNVKDGIFKLICEKAYTTKNAPNFEDVYQTFVNDKFENNFELKTQFRHAPFDVEVSQKGDCYSISRGEKKARTGYSKKTIQDYLINGTKLPYSDPYFYPICDYIKNNYPFEVVDAEAKPHILIIDEINRGNVSQIFGELITLIEDSKRKGESEELEITLPYSKEKFSVPNNLYIIGTMNTADRSVEALDTALRRRFIFKEMPPKPELLSVSNLLKIILAKSEENSEITALEAARARAFRIKNLLLNEGENEQASEVYKFIFEVIDFSALLTAINQRLSALLSKDHTIGHAYFIGCRTQKDLETVFYQKIIPLLQEYFYGDLSKIQWIIGTDFVKVEDVKTEIFMRSEEKPYSLPKKVVFEKPKDFLLSIKKIYGSN